LVDEADDDEIETEIRLSTSVQDLAERLVDLANRNGGRDNITVVVVDFTVSDEEVTVAELEEPVVVPETGSPTAIEPITEEITEELIVVTAIPQPEVVPSTPSRWFTVATYAMWLASAAITATVIISAITSSQ
jgi:hypothetical protein